MYITIVPLYSLYKLHIHCPEKEKERDVKPLLLSLICGIAARHR